MKLIVFACLVCSALLVTGGGCNRQGRESRPPTASAPSFKLAMDVSNSTLADFTAADLPLLKRHLAISPAWKLTEDSESLVAVRREAADESSPEAGKLRMTPDGFYFKHQPWRRYRLRLGVGAAPPSPGAEWDAIRTEAVPGGPDTALLVVPSSLPDHRSHLLLSGETVLHLEILEDSMDRGREMTKRLWRETNAELDKLLDLSEDEVRSPALAGVTPAASTAKAPQLTVERSSRSHGYHAFGYVNPKAEGAVYTQLFAADGQPILADEVRTQTLEYTGWTANGTPAYFFNSAVQLSAQAPLPARAELWFAPENGSAERKLLDCKVK